MIVGSAEEVLICSMCTESRFIEDRNIGTSNKPRDRRSAQDSATRVEMLC
jgi:hypothetical protein